MILYVNGDSHAAAAEAVNSYAFAEDDPALQYLKRLPHPDNLAVSWGKVLSELLKATLICDAESAASNARILRTTRTWVDRNITQWHRAFIIIGWSTWEREEWFIDGQYYQVNGSGVDQVPKDHIEKYKNYVNGLDWKEKMKQAHEDIWLLHKELDSKGIKHFFFNCNNDFSKIQQRLDWGHCYLDPYNPEMTYHGLLKSAGFDTVSPDSWHYDKQAHSKWARYLLDHLIKHKML